MPKRGPIHRPAHQRSPKQAQHAYDQQRGKTAARGYGRDWQRLRRAFLTKFPLCRMCEERGKVVVADLVDHIVPVKRAPNLRLVESNLQSLCTACHAVKTAADNAKA